MPKSSPRYRFEICPPEDYLEALGVLYRRIAARWRPGAVADAYAEVTAGDVDLSGLWVARTRSKIIGACLTQTLAGQAAAIWPPEVEPGWNRSFTTTSLLQTAIDHLRDHGVLLVQALLDPENAPSQAAIDLERAGIPRVTILSYLQRDTFVPLPIAADVPRFQWQFYNRASDPDFREVLEATYQGSLDMPELEGVRSLERIRDGQAMSGRFEPRRWQVGRLPGEPNASAVVILGELPDKSAWEVAYLGLSPSARGRGLGRVALGRAIELAAPWTSRIELAVDVRNTPAERLYQSAGFVAFDRRIVHLAVLARSNEASSSTRPTLTDPPAQSR